MYWLECNVITIHITSVWNDCLKVPTVMSIYYQVYHSYMNQATVTCKLNSKLSCSEWLTLLSKTECSGRENAIVPYELETNMGNIATACSHGDPSNMKTVPLPRGDGNEWNRICSGDPSNIETVQLPRGDGNKWNRICFNKKTTAFPSVYCYLWIRLDHLFEKCWHVFCSAWTDEDKLHLPRALLVLCGRLSESCVLKLILCRTCMVKNREAKIW